MIDPGMRALVSYLVRIGAPGFLPNLDSVMLEGMKDGRMGSHRFMNRKADRHFGRVAARCQFADADGVPVSAALILDQEGELFELEVWKVDFSPLRRWPTVADLPTT